MLMIYYLYDLFEILFFSFAIYKMSEWITTNNNYGLWSFWSYSSFLIISYSLSLNNTFTLLVILSPILATLFIVSHQETIQKSFLAAKTKNYKYDQHADWVKILIKDCMALMHNNQNLSCIVQKNYDISLLVDNPYPLEVQIISGLITLLGSSSEFDCHKFLLVTKEGVLKGVNSSVNSVLEDSTTWFETTHHLTKKLDALALKTSSQTQTFNIVIAGEIMRNRTATQTQELVSNFLKMNLPENKGSNIYGYQPKNYNKQV